MNLTYQELVKDSKIFRHRSWQEAKDVIRETPTTPLDTWDVDCGVLVIEDEPNDLVVRFRKENDRTHLTFYERVTRKTLDGRRMYDDHCRLLYRGYTLHRNGKVKVDEDRFESGQLERKRTLDELHRYAHLLEEDELAEFQSAYDPGALKRHRRERNGLFRSVSRLADAMNRYLASGETVFDSRVLVHKTRRFSPRPIRPTCEFYTLKRSFARRIRRNEQA